MSNVAKICQHRTVTLSLLRMWFSHREQLAAITTCTFEELLKNISLQKYKNLKKKV